MIEKLPKDAALEQVIWTVNRLIEQDLPFIDITDSLMKHSSKAYNTRTLNKIGRIVIHHVGDPTGADVSPQQTARYHVAVRKWPGIGYHFYIRKDGTAYQTNHLNVVSYHCGGACNTASVGICLEGSFIKGREPTEEQLASTKRVIDWLTRELGLSKKDVLGHQEIGETSCPGNTWGEWKTNIL